MALEVELATRAGAPYGMVQGAEGISVGRGVKAPRTAQLVLPEGHSLRAAARQAPLTIAKVYDRLDDGTRTLKHCGPLTSYKRDAGDNVSTALGSTDAAWYLDHRLLALANPTQKMQKRGDVMKWVVMRLQDETIADAAYNVTDPTTGVRLYDLVRVEYAFGSNPVYLYFGERFDTGIRVRSIADTPNVLIESHDYAKASGLFAQATAGLDGPDWHVYPSEPFDDAQGVRLGWLDVAPTIGVQRPDCIFEYGAGKRNVVSFEEVIDPNTMAVAVTAVTPTGAMTGVYDSAQFLNYGPLEDVIQTQIPSEPYNYVNGVANGPGAMVRQLIDDHIAVRKTPRQVITFTVDADVEPSSLALDERRIPRPGVDYDFGDTVIFRATERVPMYGDDGTLITFVEELTVDAWFRVYHVQESDDASGQRVTQLTVVAA